MRKSRSIVRAAVLASMAALFAPGIAGAQQGPPPPVSTTGKTVKLVASGIPTPSQIVFGKGRTFAASPGDEETGEGAGVHQIDDNGTVTRIAEMPVLGLAYADGTLYGTSLNKVIAWSHWSHRKFTQTKVIFERPAEELPFLETLAIGPDGRLYMGSSDAGDTGPFGTPLSGRVLSIATDGSDLQELAKGLRQPFGIAFTRGDSMPWVGNESDENEPAPPDFLIHLKTGSDFGFPQGCQWADPAAPACAGKTPPTLLLPPHSSPTGMVGAGRTLYTAYFGGTENGPEVRAMRNGVSTQIISSALPLVGMGRQGDRIYFSDVGGSIWRVNR